MFMHLNPFVKEHYRTVDWFNRTVDVTDAACVENLVHVPVNVILMWVTTV